MYYDGGRGHSPLSLSGGVNILNLVTGSVAPPLLVPLLDRHLFETLVIGQWSRDHQDGWCLCFSAHYPLPITCSLLLIKFCVFLLLPMLYLAFPGLFESQQTLHSTWTSFTGLFEVLCFLPLNFQFYL